MLFLLFFCLEQRPASLVLLSSELRYCAHTQNTCILKISAGFGLWHESLFDSLSDKVIPSAQNIQPIKLKVVGKKIIIP